MKCQAQVWREGTRYNLRRVLRSYEQGQCKRNAVAKLGKLCLCNLHIQLAKDGLMEEDGAMVSPGELRDVRKYPKKFPGGLFSWAKNLEPVKEIP